MSESLSQSLFRRGIKGAIRQIEDLQSFEVLGLGQRQPSLIADSRMRKSQALQIGQPRTAGDCGRDCDIPRVPARADRVHETCGEREFLQVLDRGLFYKPEYHRIGRLVQ